MRATDRLAPALRRLEAANNEVLAAGLALIDLLRTAQAEADLHDVATHAALTPFLEALSHAGAARQATLVGHEQVHRLAIKFGIVYADERIGDGRKYEQMFPSARAA